MNKEKQTRILEVICGDLRDLLEGQREFIFAAYERAVEVYEGEKPLTFPITLGVKLDLSGLHEKITTMASWSVREKVDHETILRAPDMIDQAEGQTDE